MMIIMLMVRMTITKRRNDNDNDDNDATKKIIHIPFSDKVAKQTLFQIKMAKISTLFS